VQQYTNGAKLYNKLYNYFKGDYDSMNNHFLEMDWSSKFEGHDINHNYNLFVQIVSSAVDNYIPTVSKAKKQSPLGNISCCM